MACTPAKTTIDACAPIVAPNDFDFPYDVNLDVVACTYDANGDPLVFSWTSSSPALGTLDFNVCDVNFENCDDPTNPTTNINNSNTATVSIVPPEVTSGGVTTYSYFQDDTLSLQLAVADAEDTTSVSTEMNFCAGWFPDEDEDGYGATTDYHASCANTVSATFNDPAPANTNKSVVQGTDYDGLDCLDEGTIPGDASLRGSLAVVTSLSATDVQDTVPWYIDYDGDGYGAMVGGTGSTGSSGGQFDITVGSVTETINIVYEDPTRDCVLTNPTVTLDTTLETKNYVLNTEDCNDILDFSDGVYTQNPATGGLGASNQNPESTWYADIDGDGFAMASSTDTSPHTDAQKQSGL